MWKSLVTKLGHPGLFSGRQIVSPVGVECVPSNLIQHVRTTFILRRKNPPPLHKQNQRPKRLKNQQFIYELVENTDFRKQADIEVILTSYVDGYGVKGDRVSVRPHIAYKDLLLPGLAVYPSPENVAKYNKEELAVQKEEEQHSSPYAERTVGFLSKFNLSVVMNKEMPWTIEPWHIRASFRKAGIIMPTEAITLPERPISGPDLSLENKVFYVTVTINNLEKAHVKCQLHHWSTKLQDRLPYAEDPWFRPADLMFSETDAENKSV